MQITGTGLPFAVWSNGKGLLICQKPDSRGCPSASSSKVKEARDNIVPEVGRICSWDASKHIPKSSFAVMSLAIVVELYCSNSQEKVLVLDSLVLTNIPATALLLTGCKWYRSRIGLIAVTFHNDRLPASDKIRKVVLLRWFPCDFSHMGPKTPDALKCA